MNIKLAAAPIAVIVLLLAACGSTTTPKSSSTSPSQPAGSVVPALPGAAGAQLWVQTYHDGGGAGASPGSVVVSRDAAKVVVAGSAGTVAYDAITGARLWVAASDVFVGSGGSTPAPTAALSPDGTKVFVAGSDEKAGDFATFAYDTTTGKQLWASRYNGPANSSDGARAVAVSPDGATVYVKGMSQGSSGLDLATVAYGTATGDQLWAARYPGPSTDETGRFAAMLPAPQSLAISPDGATVVVTGTSRTTSTGLDYATIAYNAKTGQQRWVSRYNGPANHNDGGGTPALTPSGDTLLVAGISETTPGAGDDYALVAVNASTGTQLWVQRHKATSGLAGGLGVSPDGTTVYAVGATSSGQNYATVAYTTATGKQLWISSYVNGEPKSLAVSPNGTVYVAGSTGDYTTTA